MSFFTDPTISRLTSGTLQQNTDLAGMSFPRRFGVRFHPSFMKKFKIIGKQARWQCYEDSKFEKSLGKEFYHEDLITEIGWARAYFKGIFENDISYLKLEVIDQSKNMLIRTFYFEFKKGYQTSLNGKKYMEDPILHEKLVKDGLLVELKQYKDKNTGEISYKKEKSSFVESKITDFDMDADDIQINEAKTNMITQKLVRYSEKPKMVFLVGENV